jgi:hypothetical protein
MLDIRVSTCEVYERKSCDYSRKRLIEKKTHCKTSHNKSNQLTLIVHVKMDRETFSEKTYTNYWSDQI